MQSWDVLDPVVLKASGNISQAFIGVGVADFRAAAKFISCLPYGRNTIVDDLHRLATTRNVFIGSSCGDGSLKMLRGEILMISGESGKNVSRRCVDERRCVLR